MAAFVAAEPINPSNWITPNDYPSRALEKSHGGISGFRLTVSNEGRPVRCDITGSSGYENLDRLTCKLMMTRARFKPALDATGQPALAVYHNQNTWWVSGMPEWLLGASRPEMQLSVERMPGGVDDPVIMPMALVVDAEGGIIDCAPVPPSEGLRGEMRERRLKAITTLGKAGCAQARALFKPQAGLDSSGGAVASIQTIRLLFATEARPR